MAARSAPSASRTEAHEKAAEQTLRRLRPSKKWHCHFFEEVSLRSAPQLSADSGQFDARFAQSVFCHAQVAAKNKFYSFRVCGRETLRGFIDSIKQAVP